MNNGTIKNAQITCETGGTVLQTTYLNVAQETLQQLLASELTGKQPYPILYKQGDIEQRAIELAEAVGSAFTALDCLPVQLSGLHDRAQIVDDLSLEVFHHINVLLKRITGSDSKCGEDPEERKRPSNVINRTEHFVANAETTLKSAIINLREIHEALDNSIMTLGVDITDAASTYSAEFNRVTGMDGKCSQLISDNVTGDVTRHSDAHWIASSHAAGHNPILALKLIKCRASLDEAISSLQSSHRSLSEFTKRKMIEVCPCWELMDAEERNMEALTYSKANDDANGYWAGFNAAQRKLEKYVEPW
ncbi:Uncharacterised protein [Yersinia enterocolitica]|nr:Uncharacterised protein [Yersinia enterocolitica]